MFKRQLQTILVPAILIGGYVFFSSRDGFLADAWEDFAGPFLLTYWIGLGFVITWEVLRRSLHQDKASPRAMALWGIGLGLFMLMMLGGPAVLIEDPWLFGVAIAPGIELALPWLHGRAARAATTTGDKGNQPT